MNKPLHNNSDEQVAPEPIRRQSIHQKHLPQKHLSQEHACHEHVYQEQQVLLFWLLSKILRRLARRIAWTRLSGRDKRRLNTTLTMLESDVQLVRTVVSTRPLNRTDSALRAKKVKGIAAPPQRPPRCHREPQRKVFDVASSHSKSRIREG